MNINMMVKLIINAINSVEFGNVYIDNNNILTDRPAGWGERADYIPARVCGVWDPERADATLRAAQSRLYRLMAAAGMPLYGWDEFDTFTELIADGIKVDKAYKAIAGNPATRRREIRRHKEYRRNIKLHPWADPLIEFEQMLGIYEPTEAPFDA